MSQVTNTAGKKKWMKIPSNLLVFQDKIKLTAVLLFSAS